MQGPKEATTDTRMTGYKAQDRTRDLSRLKHYATRNNVTIETVTIYL